MNFIASEREKALPSVFLGIVYEYQVFHATSGPEGRATLTSTLVRAETADDARFLVEEGCGQLVYTVGPGRPIVDWSKPYLTRDEAEAKACCSSTTISDAIREGKIRKCGGRERLFASKEVDSFIEGNSS